MITGLKIVNIMGIEEAEIDLTTPLNFFGGLNEAGKSTIRDSILWAFTGQARGLKTHEQQAALIREGAKTGEVSVFLSGGHAFTRRKTQKSAATVLGDIPDIGLNPAILFDPYTFLSYPEDQRRELLFKIIPGLNPTTENILNSLVRWPAVEAIPIPDEECLPGKKGFLTSILETTAKMAVSHGFPATEKEAVIKRREAKRVRETLQETHKPENMVVIEGTEYDILSMNLAAIKATLKDLQAEKDDLLRQKGARESQARHLTQIQEQLRGMTVIGAVDPVRITKLEGDLEVNLKALSANAQAITDNTVKSQTFPATCPAITIMQMACPKAGIVIGATPPPPGTLEGLQKTRMELTKKADELGAELSKLKQQAESCRMAAERKKFLEEELSKLQVEPEAGTDLDTEIAQRQQRIDRGHAFDKAILDYNAALERYQDTQTKLAACAQEIVIYDALQKALAPEGIPSQMIAEALEGFNVLLDQAAIFLFPGRYLHLTGDLGIVLQNSPFTTLSKSAKFRVGIAFQYALAKLTGARVLLIDEMDVLDLDHQAGLVDFLLDRLSDFDQIMVFFTANEARAVCKDPRCGNWWLDNGKVRELYT